ncbi:MAG TPA: KEOPS complex subunit Pcc1 [Methanomassiliicoccales archaeon]|nr:KEOPS complex subunit Pcc1 [Methanomassiliicoccales archaeon]
MAVRCSIEIDFKGPKEALAVLRSIELDNGPYASVKVSGNVLIIEADAKSMPSMLHTLEDLLACVKVAEGMVDLG